MAWLREHGYELWLPLGHSSNADLLAEREERLVRVQVKTSTQFQNQRWLVMLCTHGGNQSWSGVVKRFSAARCDWLFAHVGDGRRWFIPAKAVAGTTAIALGGPRYSQFEVERGSPLPTGGAA